MARAIPDPSGRRVPVRPALLGLVAMLTLTTLELVRASGPLLDLAYGRGGVVAVAGAALLSYLFAGPVAAVLLLAARRESRSLLVVGAGLLGVLRLVVQALEGAARFLVALPTVAVGIAVLTVAVAVLASRPGGGRAAAGALLAGAAAGVGGQLALGTWDAFWRHAPLGWAVSLALVGGLWVLAVLAGRDPATPPLPRVGRLWVLGPFLALLTMVLANPAFAASQAGAPLAPAGAVTALGLLLSAWSVGRPRRHLPPWVAAGLLPLLVAAVFVLGEIYAVLVLPVLVGAQLTAAGSLAAGLDSADPAPAVAAATAPSVAVTLRLAGTAGLVGVGTILPLLVYQVDYDLPLGFPNALVLVATAAVLAGMGLRRSVSAPTATGPVRSPVPWVLLGSGAGLVVLGAVVAGSAWLTYRSTQLGAVGAEPAAGSGRVVSWNLHYGVGPTGALDLEATARVIEAQDPDVVLLQEVSRGWVLGGGADMATWLSQRLDRQLAFAPAADRQFGNAVLARERPAEVEALALPYGQGPQRRSALSADVRVGEGRVRVTSVHLQNRRANTATRELQLDTLLADLDRSGAAGPARIVGGDLNAPPGSTEIALLTGADFVSAVDAVGDPNALTSPSVAPRTRIDWVFGRGVTFSRAEVVTGALTSDHLPLVVETAP